MAATKYNIRAPAVLVGLLLATCLLLAATAADASRPLNKVSSSSSSLSEGDGSGARRTVESPPVGGYSIIQAVVVGTGEQDAGAAGGAGHRLMNVDMLRGIKDSGPSPGAGH